MLVIVPGVVCLLWLGTADGHFEAVRVFTVRGSHHESA